MESLDTRVACIYRQLGSSVQILFQKPIILDMHLTLERRRCIRTFDISIGGMT
ncbi:hypothetical protein MTR67_044117 [Solanum verrucosum]|uniref:Uncharacterized protein n=1 Tax=Solanum verrucosum TaxID=315347 RepID=A0AAF0ZSM3_SOLVR|nr:hypothetical protein MTR67_044117 [Solanum verrucosum]